MFSLFKVHYFLFRFEEVINLVDRYENMTALYEGKQLKSQKQDLLQYYKYRKFIPMFGITKQASTIHNYYYERYKVYYNQIKKRLNITVEKTNSDESSQKSSYEEQESNISSNYDNSKNSQKKEIKNNLQSKILRDLTTDIPTNTYQNNQEDQQDIRGYKSQSKALEDLLYLLKSNDKFRYVQPLKFQNSLKFPSKSSKQLFKDTVVNRAKQFEDYNTKNRHKKKIFITFGNKKTIDSQGASKKYLSINLKQLNQKKRTNSKKRQSINSDQKKFNKKKRNSDLLIIPSAQRSKNLQVMKKLSKIKKQILDNKLSQINLYRQQQYPLNKNTSKINSKIFIKSIPKNNIFYEEQDHKLIRRSVSRGSMQGRNEKAIKNNKISDDHINKILSKQNQIQKNNKIQKYKQQSPYYQKLVSNTKNRQIKQSQSQSKKDLRKYHSQKKIKNFKQTKIIHSKQRKEQSFGKEIKLKSINKNNLKDSSDFKNVDDAMKIDTKRRRSVDLTKIKHFQLEYQSQRDKERILQNFIKQSLKKNKRQYGSTDSQQKNTNNNNLKLSPQHSSKDVNNNFPPSLSNLYTMDLLPSKFGIKTAPNSPKKSHNLKYRQSNQFKIQKQDNIVSINKKKLQMLKQKAQTFKKKIQIQ